MANPLPDRWSSRDFPVLVEVARMLDSGQRHVRVNEITEQGGFERDDVMHALNALVPAYLSGKPLDTMGGRVDFFVSDLTERGRRTVGLWPSGEPVEAFVDALRQAEEATDDPEEKGALRRAAGAVLGVGRDVMTDVMAAVIAKQIGA